MKTKRHLLRLLAAAAIAAFALAGCKEETPRVESAAERQSREALEEYARENEPGGNFYTRAGRGRDDVPEDGGHEAPQQGGVPKIPPPAPGEKISFTGHVAPIILTHCGRCHIEDTKGDLDFKTYASLLKGTPDGSVVIAGQPDTSSFVTLVEDGEMPKRGGPVDAKHIKVLREWVAQGARFDGADTNAPLTGMVSEDLQRAWKEGATAAESPINPAAPKPTKP